MKYYRLIKDYPGRKYGDLAVFDENVSDTNYFWESDSSLIPKEFQPDVTPKWFEETRKLKEYILIKKYPGSPELGEIWNEYAIINSTITTDDEHGDDIESKITDYPEFWEEIK